MNNDFSMDTINTYIDQSNYNLTHYDISVVVYKVLKDLYRYKGTRRWEYFDTIDKIWKDDIKKKKFKQDIKTIMSDIYVTRYMYWHTIANSSQNINVEIHAKFMTDKMFRASCKVKDDKFISVVIKEAQPFFDIYNV